MRSRTVGQNHPQSFKHRFQKTGRHQSAAEKAGRRPEPGLHEMHQDDAQSEIIFGKSAPVFAERFYFDAKRQKSYN